MNKNKSKTVAKATDVKPQLKKKNGIWIKVLVPLLTFTLGAGTLAAVSHYVPTVGNAITGSISSDTSTSQNNTVKQSEYDDLKSRYDSLHTDYTLLSTEINTTKLDLEKVRSDLKVALDNYNNTKTTLEEKETKLTETNASLETKKQELETLQIEKGNIETQLSEKQAELDNALSNNESNTNRINELNEEIGQLNVSIQEKETQLSAITQELNEKNETIQNQNLKIETLQSEINSLNISLSAKQTELDNALSDNETNLETIATLNSEISDLESNITLKNLELENTQLQLQIKNEEITSLNSTITTLRSNISELEEDIANYKSQITELTNTINSKNNEINLLRSNLDTLSKDIAYLNLYLFDDTSIFSQPGVFASTDAFCFINGTLYNIYFGNVHRYNNSIGKFEPFEFANQPTDMYGGQIFNYNNNLYYIDKSDANKIYRLNIENLQWVQLENNMAYYGYPSNVVFRSDFSFKSNNIFYYLDFNNKKSYRFNDSTKQFEQFSFSSDIDNFDIFSLQNSIFHIGDNYYCRYSLNGEYVLLSIDFGSATCNIVDDIPYSFGNILSASNFFYSNNDTFVLYDKKIYKYNFEICDFELFGFFPQNKSINSLSCIFYLDDTLYFCTGNNYYVCIQIKDYV